MNTQSPLKQKVLIVDDDEIVLAAYKRSKIMEDDRYEVLMAENGAHAIAIIQMNKPSVVLADLMMPGTDGFQILKYVQGLPEEKRPMMFILSSVRDEVTIAKAKELGATDYIVKSELTPDLISGLVEQS